MFIASSAEDGYWVNLLNGKEEDIDELYQIAAICEIIYDHEDEVFYILSNKYEQRLGFFVLKMGEIDPKKAKFLIKWKNKLDIGDTSIFVMRNHEAQTKEIVISFKTIYINTYNIFVMDCTVEDDKTINFRHESFQLWESECCGILVQQKKDFIMVNRDGISILSLGQVDKKPVIDSGGQDRMIHSLSSYNFLKIAPENYLLFGCQKTDKRQIEIQQEYTRSD